MNEPGIMRQLCLFRELEENWDSYGAAKIDQRAIDSAMRILEGWQVVPTASGGVQIEVHTSGADIEIAIAADGNVEYAGAYDKNGAPMEE